MDRVQAALAELKDRYCELHTRKEDLFWSTKMGLADDVDEARRQAAEAEKDWNRFVQDPGRLASLRDLQSRAGRIGDAPGRPGDGAAGAQDEEALRTLGGWIAMLGAHVIDSTEGRRLSEELVELEGELERRRQAMPLSYSDPDTGRPVRASSVKLALMLRADPDERRRKAAFDGLRSVERFVLDAGFLRIVRLRNRLGRLLGYQDYYDWRVSVVEGLRKRRLFEMLDDLAARTADTTRRALESFAGRHGEGALDPWNFAYLRTGSLTQQLDPYFAFGPALQRWMRSFQALGVRYRGARLTLDLVDRPGKYENGFMHGPEPAFLDGERWRPARINFAANAVVGQVGAGMRASRTLFHEGGHAAHFSNIIAKAPCFSQEFAPTSVAYAETQSMFMGSLLEDAQWRTRYARDDTGHVMPMELVELSIREQQPFLAWDQRAMLTIPFAERVLYELPDDALRGDRVLEEVRAVERRLQGLSAGVRPVLAVPHLLAGESSAYYHGYVLAQMAVHQIRRFFLDRDGHLTDNPRIGPDLAKHCWMPGNAVRFETTLEALTGGTLSADALVDRCNTSVDETILQARGSVGRMASVPEDHEPIDLDGEIRVMHGRDLVATTREGGCARAAEDFDKWIGKLESRA